MMEDEIFEEYINEWWMITSLIADTEHCSNKNTRSLRWRHNERDVVSNHRYLDCLFTHLLKRRSQKT